MTDQSRHHAAHSSAESFAFAEDRHTAVYICQHVAAGAPVLLAEHEGNGDWQFLCGGAHAEDELPRIVCLEHVVAADLTLNELAPMCINHEAQRSAAAEPWTIVDLGEDFIRRCVEEHGWAVQGVAEDAEGPGFSYSVGLHRCFGHAELIVIGLPNQVAARVLNELGERIRIGARLQAGQLLDEVLGHPVKLHSVREPQSIKEHMGYALWFYDGRPFELLQVLWPDQQHRFPDDENASESFARAQPVLP
jgi:hypothetical protein